MALWQPKRKAWCARVEKSVALALEDSSAFVFVTGQFR
jgi:hypothetical protein